MKPRGCFQWERLRGPPRIIRFESGAALLSSVRQERLGNTAADIAFPSTSHVFAKRFSLPSRRQTAIDGDVQLDCLPRHFLPSYCSLRSEPRACRCQHATR